MITVVAKIFVKEGKAEEYAATAKKLEAATNSLEPECISYRLYVDSKNPNVFTFIEEWESKDSLKKHAASSHYQAASAIMAGLLEKPTEMAIYNKVV